MEGKNKLEEIKFIFGSLFVLANKMQAIGDKYLEEITAKQWLLLVTVSQFEENPPTLGQVATFMGTSHQNAKQIALKLENKGFINIEKDLRDSRALRLSITSACKAYFKEREGKDTLFLEELFKSLNHEEVHGLSIGLYKLMEQIGKIDPNLKTEQLGWVASLFSRYEEE